MYLTLLLAFIFIALIVFVQHELGYFRKGMVGIWWDQPKFKFDPLEKTLVVQTDEVNHKFPLNQISSLHHHRIDWPESTEKDNSSFLARQAVKINLTDGSQQTFRFDIDHPRAFLKELENQGVAVKLIWSND